MIILGGYVRIKRCPGESSVPPPPSLHPRLQACRGMLIHKVCSQPATVFCSFTTHTNTQTLSVRYANLWAIPPFAANTAPGATHPMSTSLPQCRSDSLDSPAARLEPLCREQLAGREQATSHGGCPGAVRLLLSTVCAPNNFANTGI